MGPLIADWPNIALSLASDTKQTDSISLSYNFTLDEQLLKDETSFKFPCWPLTAVLTMLAWSGCSAGWWPSWCRWSRCPRTECSSTGPSVLVISEISWGRKRMNHVCCQSKDWLPDKSDSEDGNDDEGEDAEDGSDHRPGPGPGLWAWGHSRLRQRRVLLTRAVSLLSGMEIVFFKIFRLWILIQSPTWSCSNTRTFQSHSRPNPESLNLSSCSQ